MTRLAIWRAETLLGKEIKDTLAQRRDLWDDLRLLGPESDSALVSEIGDEAALILPGTEDNLSDVDLLFFCTDPGEVVEIPPGLPATATTIVVSGDDPGGGESGDGESSHAIPRIVAGINSARAGAEGGAGDAQILASAHPAAVALAHLLQPLLELGLESCEASVLLPSTIRGQQGIDELFAQTRAILAFQPQPKESVFGHQLAFNLLPSFTAGGHIAASVGEALGRDGLRVAVQTSVGGVFHCMVVGAHVRVAASVDEGEIREALEASPIVEFAEHPEALGPIDAAGSASLLVGAIEATSTPGGFWLRAVMDNLTAGGALNAIGIAEAVLGAGGPATDDLTN